MKYAEIEICKNSGKSYTYAIPDYLKGSLEVDDRVAVLVNPHGREHGSYMIGKVVGLIDYPNVNLSEYEFVIDKIDTKRWKEWKAKAEQLRMLEDAMEARIRKANSLLIYKQLAETDEEMKKLLEAYEQLAS